MAYGSGDRAPSETAYDHARILVELQSRIDTWMAPGRSLAEQQVATHGLCWWVGRQFGGEYEECDEFEGTELPAALRPLVRHEWQDEEHFGRDNTVRVESRYDQEIVEPVIPQWGEITARHQTFEDMVAEVRRSPDIIASIRPGQIRLRPEIAVTFEPRSLQGWGMYYVVRRGGISLSVYGKCGDTQSVSDFLVTYHGKPLVLQEVVCELAMLFVRHNEHRAHISIGQDQLMQLDLLLAGMGDFEPIDTRKLKGPRRGLAALAIERLTDEGLL